MPKIVVSKYGMTDDYNALMSQLVKFDKKDWESINVIRREDSDVIKDTWYYIAVKGEDIYLIEYDSPDYNHNAVFALLSKFDNYCCRNEFDTALGVAVLASMDKTYISKHPN